jgi:hypothetical protein
MDWIITELSSRTNNDCDGFSISYAPLKTLIEENKIDEYGEKLRSDIQKVK